MFLMLVFVNATTCYALTVHATKTFEEREKKCKNEGCTEKELLIKTCHKRPDLCDKNKSRFSTYKPNYIVYQKTNDDDNSFEARLSLQYYFTRPHCINEDDTVDVSCLNNYKKRSEWFFTYTGEFDFYFLTRESDPVINRLNNPAFHYRKHFDSSSEQNLFSLEWFNLGLEHRSNGQVTRADAKIGDRFVADIRYDDEEFSYIDGISRDSNYLSFETKLNAGNGNHDNNKCKKNISCFNIWLSGKIYLSEESDVYWGPTANQGLKISDYDRFKVIVSNVFYDDRINLTFEWTVGDELFDTDSYDISMRYTVDFGEGIEIPFYIRAHIGPMNTLSDYTREQNSIGFGLVFD